MKEPGSPRKVRLGACFTEPKFIFSRRPQHVIPRYRPTQEPVDGEFAQRRWNGRSQTASEHPEK
jgi:hypothetical protein